MKYNIINERYYGERKWFLKYVLKIVFKHEKNMKLYEFIG